LRIYAILGLYEAQPTSSLREALRAVLTQGVTVLEPGEDVETLRQNQLSEIAALPDLMKDLVALNRMSDEEAQKSPQYMKLLDFAQLGGNFH
jgi:hypothetical protein